jgi:hypothetical protein
MIGGDFKRSRLLHLKLRDLPVLFSYHDACLRVFFNCATRSSLLMTKNLRQKGPSRRLGWLVLLIIVLAALAIVAAPVWIIQPFKPQTDRGLAVSYALRRWSPLLTISALVISSGLVFWLWSGSRRWIARILLAILLLPVLAAVWFARQNHFEWMFNPLTNSAYAKASDASFVGEQDMVLAVENNGEAVAYPVRLMAYHHVVGDTVGGTPIVATY